MIKYFLFMILGACSLLLILPAFAAGDPAHGDRVRMDKHDNFHGDTYIYRSKPTLETTNEGVCVYEKPGFEGRFQCWSADTDISDLSFGNWNNKIASVRVFGQTRLVGYKDTDFRSDRIILDHDAADLGTFPMARGGNWNHEIRSLSVQHE